MNRIAWIAIAIASAAPGAIHAQGNAWRFDGDARVYAGYFDQASRAGTNGFTSTSWLMLQAVRASGNATLGVHTMLSGDPLLNGKCGQPRLFPSAFDCGDSKSMSHPLIMGLGVFASTDVGATNLFANISIVGEPAFGPAPHFMRASSAFDPAEPLMHHFFTPAHSAAGMITVGAARGAWKFGGSVFNSRTVSDRYRIDLAPLNAYAGRLSLTTSPNSVLQVSAAYFPAHEAGGHHGHAGDMRAYSATASGRYKEVAYTAGCAVHRTAGHSPGACMLEGTLTAMANTFFMRAETGRRLDQTTEAEVLPDGSHAHFTRNSMLNTGEVAVGYARDVWNRGGVRTSVGGRAGLTLIPDYFKSRYQERRPTSFLVFISARPTGGATAHH